MDPAPDDRELLFPYMFWAHEASFASPYCLAQSGMPAPAAEVLGGIDPAELVEHPSARALPRLEARLAELFDVAPECVLVTVGASGAMHACASPLFRPGTRVAAELPSYEPLRALPTLFGAELVTVARRLADGWLLAPANVRAALAGAPGAGHVFLTNPHNPSGAVMDAERVKAIADEAARAGGALVSCEVYMEYAPTNAERVHAARLAPNAVSIGSLTKAYGLGALRIGWLILGEGLARERRRFQDATYLAYGDPPTASLVGASRALERLPALLAPLRRIEVESRPHFLRWLAETDGVEAAPPPFGIIGFARLPGIEDTHALQRTLAAEFGVDVVAGEYFGAPGHVRVACGVPEATLVEGLVRLGDGLRSFRERE